MLAAAGAEGDGADGVAGAAAAAGGGGAGGKRGKFKRGFNTEKSRLRRSAYKVRLGKDQRDAVLYRRRVAAAQEQDEEDARQQLAAEEKGGGGLRRDREAGTPPDGEITVQRKPLADMSTDPELVASLREHTRVIQDGLAAAAGGGGSYEALCESIVHLRNIVVIDPHAPPDGQRQLPAGSLLASGAVEGIVQTLLQTSDKVLQKETSFCLINLSASGHAINAELRELNLAGRLLELLQPQRKLHLVVEAIENIVWTIANLVQFSIEVRDEVVSSGGLETVLSFLSEDAGVGMVRNVVWLVRACVQHSRDAPMCSSEAMARQVLHSLNTLLQSADELVISDCLAAYRFLLEQSDSALLPISLELGLPSRILTVISTTRRHSLMTPAMRCLAALLARASPLQAQAIHCLNASQIVTSTLRIVLAQTVAATAWHDPRARLFMHIVTGTREPTGSQMPATKRIQICSELRQRRSAHTLPLVCFAERLFDTARATLRKERENAATAEIHGDDHVTGTGSGAMAEEETAAGGAGTTVASTAADVEAEAEAVEAEEAEAGSTPCPGAITMQSLGGDDSEDEGGWGSATSAAAAPTHQARVLPPATHPQADDDRVSGLVENEEAHVLREAAQATDANACTLGFTLEDLNMYSEKYVTQSLMSPSTLLQVNTLGTAHDAALECIATMRVLFNPVNFDLLNAEMQEARFDQAQRQSAEAPEPPKRSEQPIPATSTLVLGQRLQWLHEEHDLVTLLLSCMKGAMFRHKNEDVLLVVPPSSVRRASVQLCAELLSIGDAMVVDLLTNLRVAYLACASEMQLGSAPDVARLALPWLERCVSEVDTYLSVPPDSPEAQGTDWAGLQRVLATCHHAIDSLATHDHPDLAHQAAELSGWLESRAQLVAVRV